MLIEDESNQQGFTWENGPLILFLDRWEKFLFFTGFHVILDSDVYAFWNIYQMRAIKEELGDNDDDEDDVAALERKMQDAAMPANIWKHAQRELRYEIGRNALFQRILLCICFETVTFLC